MRIDTESHFWDERYLAYLRGRSKPPRVELLEDGMLRFTAGTTQDFTPLISPFQQERCLTVGEGRLRQMDENGIDIALLSLAPGVEQLEPDASIEQARLANDTLAEIVRTWPDRYVGIVTVAPRKPEESAEEIERCVTQLGFKGVNVFSHTAGELPYLDHESYWPIFEAAARLGVPVNLHPVVPHPSMVKPYLGYGWALPTTGLGFGAEAAVAAMRLILSGLFDRYPSLRMTLGHFGEALPFWTYRLDLQFTSDRFAVAEAPKCEHRASHYLTTNFWLNCSGNFSNSALMTCLFEIGADRLMFASDYPWEHMDDASAFMDAAPLSAADREKMEWRNAAELYGLDVAEGPAGPARKEPTSR